VGHQVVPPRCPLGKPVGQHVVPPRCPSGKPVGQRVVPPRCPSGKPVGQHVVSRRCPSGKPVRQQVVPPRCPLGKPVGQQEMSTYLSSVQWVVVQFDPCSISHCCAVMRIEPLTPYVLLTQLMALWVDPVHRPLATDNS